MMGTGEFFGKVVSIYARFSSANQREASLEDQIRRCREYVETRGGRVTDALVFTDAAVSGASLMRPAFERMMAAVERKQIDVIVTEDISRISRDIADSATLLKKLQYLGVQLRSVADGINTSDRSAKLTYTIKSLVSEAYLDDLRDKTLRGLEGRALAGLSTGGLPTGYRSSPVHDTYGRLTGYRIEIDPEASEVIRRIFTLYRDGRSYREIALLLNSEGVLPPRAKSRRRRKGWVASTIREILRNRAYIGERTFKKRQWVKLPGTNTRRYRPREESEVIRQVHPELAIIDEELWEQVRARTDSSRATYTKTAPGVARGGSSGRRNNYVLSGILVCGECGAAMTIASGTSASYYQCADYKKRGTCKNGRSIREDVAKERVFNAIGARYNTPEATTFLRQAMVDAIASMSRTGNAELQERRARLERTEERLRNLVDFISRGETFPSVREALADLEAQAKQEKDAIARLRETGAKPVQLPTPDMILDLWNKFERIAEHDPLQTREALRLLFAGQGLRATPQPDGRYMAEGQIDLSALFRLDLSSAGDKTPKAPKGLLGSRTDVSSSSDGCAGRI